MLHRGNSGSRACTRRIQDPKQGFSEADRLNARDLGGCLRCGLGPCDDPDYAGPRRNAPITEALQASSDPMAAPMWLPWRTGRKVGRTVYAQIGPEPTDNDVLIGVMDTRELAEEAVSAHNASLKRAQ